MVRHPLVVIGANLLVTAVLGFYALHIRVESSLASVLPAGDPEVEYYAKVQEIFGSDNIAIVGREQTISSPPRRSRRSRESRMPSRRFAVSNGCGASLTRLTSPRILSFKPPLLSRIPPTPGEIEALKKKLAASPLLGRGLGLVGNDYRGAAINVVLQNLTDVQYSDLQIDQKIREIFVKESGPEQFYFTGAGARQQSLLRLMTQDLVRFTPVALALVLAVFWMSFWTVRGVVLPVVSVLMALSWTLGVMVLVGKAITIGTFILPPLLLVIGSSYAIHVMARYYEQVDAGAPREELVVRAFERVWLPLVISAFTNIVGFGSLMVSRITAIWDLGLFAVVGLAFLTVTSLTFIPAALELMPVELRTRRSGKVSPMLSEFLRRLGKRAYVFRRPIPGHARRLRRGGGRSEPHSSGFELPQLFQAKLGGASGVRGDQPEFGGTNTFYIVLEGTEPDLFKRWEVLKQIKDLRAFSSRFPGSLRRYRSSTP